jgi:hypothetical protein
MHSHRSTCEPESKQTKRTMSPEAKEKSALNGKGWAKQKKAEKV